MNLFKGTPYFYHSHIRRVIDIFGYVFSGVSVARFNADGSINDMVNPVPIEFANRDQDLGLNSAKANSKDHDRITSGFKEEFPRITYTMNSVQINTQRIKSKNNVVTWTKEDGSVKRVAQSLPWVASFTLNLIARNQSDCLQMFEQVAAAFGPTVVVKVVDFPVEGNHFDMPISLTGAAMEDSYDSDFGDKRRVVFSLDFDVFFQLYGPTGSTVEYNAMMRNLEREVGCTVTSNDLAGLRGRSPNIDSLLDGIETIDQDAVIEEICVNYGVVPFKMEVQDDVTGAVCLPALDDAPLDIYSAVETETKTIKE